MALKAVLDSLEGISDEVKEHYTAKDGKFFLGVEPIGGWALEDIQGLKQTLAETKDKFQKSRDSLQTWDGIDFNEAKSALEKVKTMDDWSPEEKVQEQMESVKKQLLEKHSTELSTRAEELKAVLSQLQHNLVTAEASKHLAKAAPEAVELLLPHVQNQARMVKRTDGTFGVEVIGGDGIARIGNDNGKPMTLEELVTEMSNLPQFAPAFKGAGAHGTGADGQGGGGGKRTENGEPDLKDLSGIEGLRAAHNHMEATA